MQHLVEECSVRTTSQTTGVHPRTIPNLLSLAGERRALQLSERIHGLRVKYVQWDEMWGYVGIEEKTKAARGKN